MAFMSKLMNMDLSDRLPIILSVALVQLSGDWIRWIVRSCSKERPLFRMPNATAGTFWVVKCGRTKLWSTQ